MVTRTTTGYRLRAPDGKFYKKGSYNLGEPWFDKIGSRFANLNAMNTAWVIYLDEAKKTDTPEKYPQLTPIEVKTVSVIKERELSATKPTTDLAMQFRSVFRYDTEAWHFLRQCCRKNLEPVYVIRIGGLISETSDFLQVLETNLTIKISPLAKYMKDNQFDYNADRIVAVFSEADLAFIKMKIPKRLTLIGCDLRTMTEFA
jgi:hypothetical protein